MRNTYVECLDWTWPEKLLYIKACVGNEVPHNMLCGYAVSSRDEILLNYMHAKYLYCNDRGMMSYDDKDLSKPSITRNQRRVELSDLKPRTRTEYERVTESIFDLRDEFERGELYCKNLLGSDDYQKLNTEVALFGCAAASNVYQRVEKEIDERQEFVDAAIDKIEPFNCDDPSYYSDWFEQLYDAGCRFQD